MEKELIESFLLKYFKGSVIYLPFPIKNHKLFFVLIKRNNIPLFYIKYEIEQGYGNHDITFSRSFFYSIVNMLGLPHNHIDSPLSKKYQEIIKDLIINRLNNKLIIPENLPEITSKNTTMGLYNINDVIFSSVIDRMSQYKYEIDF